MVEKRNISITEYKKGAFLFVEEEASDGTFFIVQKGHIRLKKDLDIPDDDSDNILGPGDFFEVESALTGKPRTFTAIAQSDCQIVVVPKEMYNELIQKKPSLVQKIILSFSQKMRTLDQVLTRISFKQTEAATKLEHLVSIGDYYHKNDQLQPAAFAYYHYLKHADSSNVKATDRAKKQLEIIKQGHKEEELFLQEDTSKPVRAIPEGVMIFSEAMPGNTMYFIQSGSIKICKISNGLEISLAVLEKGDLFGEMALLENKPRSAIAITAKDSSLIVITHQNFPLIIKQQPNLITRITTVLAERIWFVYRQITNVMLPEGEDRLYDALLMFMEQKQINYTKKTPVDLNITVKDFLRYMGIDLKKANEYFDGLVKSNVVHLNPQGVIIIHNPSFIHSRAVHGRLNFTQKTKRN